MPPSFWRAMERRARAFADEMERLDREDPEEARRRDRELLEPRATTVTTPSHNAPGEHMPRTVKWNRCWTCGLGHRLKIDTDACCREAASAP